MAPKTPTVGLVGSRSIDHGLQAANKKTVTDYAFPAASRTPEEISIPHEGATDYEHPEKLGDSYMNSVEDTSLCARARRRALPPRVCPHGRARAPPPGCSLSRSPPHVPNRQAENVFSDPDLHRRHADAGGRQVSTTAMPRALSHALTEWWARERVRRVAVVLVG